MKPYLEPDWLALDFQVLGFRHSEHASTLWKDFKIAGHDAACSGREIASPQRFQAGKSPVDQQTPYICSELSDSHEKATVIKAESSIRLDGLVSNEHM